MRSGRRSGARRAHRSGQSGDTKAAGGVSRSDRHLGADRRRHRSAARRHRAAPRRARRANQRHPGAPVMNDGLEGVIAAETVLSHADGETGAVWVRGHTIESLAAEYGYEGAVAVMWEGFAGRDLTRAGMREALAAARVTAFVRSGECLACAAPRPLAEGVRIALAALPDDAEPAQILATLPVAIAALMRTRAGKALPAPDPALDTAAAVLD